METCNFELENFVDTKTLGGKRTGQDISISVTHDSLFISKKLMEILGSPNYVNVAFNRKNKIIGLRKSAENSAEALSVQKCGPKGGARINRKYLIKEIVDMRYFNPDKENLVLKEVMYNVDGYLCFDLKYAKERPRVRRKNTANDKLF